MENFFHWNNVRLHCDMSNCLYPAGKCAVYCLVTINVDVYVQGVSEKTSEIEE